MACDYKNPYSFMSAEGIEDYSHLSEAEFGRVWRGFKEHTTAHGISHIHVTRGPIKVTLWVILSLVSLGLLAYTVAGLIIRYTSWPVSVVVTVEHVKEIDFPAITMCNMNPIRQSMLVQSEGLNAIFSRKRRSAPAFTEETLHALNLKKYLAELDVETKEAFGHQRDDFILEMKYEGIQISTDTLYNWFDPSFGNCYTFNSGWANSSDIRTSHLSGPLYGLDVIFNIEQDEYIGTLSHSAGMRIIIHNRTTMPFPAEQGFTISPGEITFIGMVELEINRLGDQFGNCSEVSEEQNFTRNVYEEYYPVLYTAEACLHTCFQKNMIDLCNCAYHEIPVTGEAFGNVDVPVCDVTDPDGYTCFNDVKRSYINNDLDCECETACHEVEYVVTTSSGVWPSDNYQEELLENTAQAHPNLNSLLYNANDSTKFLRNLGKVSMYFSQFNREVISEKQAYTSSTFVSDIGGVLGLFVGFSVLTVAEFFELAADFLVLASCKCCCHKRNGNRQQSRIAIKPFDKKNNM